MLDQFEEMVPAAGIEGDGKFTVVREGEEEQAVAWKAVGRGTPLGATGFTGEVLWWCSDDEQWASMAAALCERGMGIRGRGN